MRPDRTFIALTVVLLGAISLPAQDQVSLTVDATMDIYRAGGYNDGSDGIAPVVFSFPAGAWRTMTFPSIGGGWSCSYSVPTYGADGTTSGPCSLTPTNLNPVGPFSGYHLTDFVGALAGVFLEDSLPASAPPALRFYVSNNADGGIQTDFLTLSPKIGQVFFIGDGLTGTGSGSVQKFFVPPTSTHLYLGYVDVCTLTSTAPGCYFDNVGSLSVTARLQQYVPDWVEPTLSTAPSARIGPALTYDAADHYTLLFGGSSAFEPGTSYGDTWVWRYGWYQLSPATSPPPRAAAGLAYDPTTGTAVLFGGRDNSDGGPLGGTWTWDGVAWTQQFPRVSPSPRNAPMVYDPITQTVLLFGGLGPFDDAQEGVTPYNDTWSWNGRMKTWTQLSPATSPSPRGSSLAYDPLTRTVLLFGGDNGAGDCCNVYYNETWTWNGITWTQQFPPNSPSPRNDVSLAYDPTLGVIVASGGYNIPGEGLADQWAWKGATWTQLSLPTQPSARWDSGMEFDPLTGGLVLFGGETTGDNVTNQTWLLIPVAVR